MMRRAHRVLVTGATGFIGRRLCARLCADGHQVAALLLPYESADSLGAAVGDIDGDIDIRRGDVTDPASVARAMASVERVYHLAAMVGDWGPDQLFWKVNVEGTRHVLDAAAASGCERVLMVSSVIVYGPKLRTGECHEQSRRAYGVGPYGQTKRASEALALSYHAMDRVPVTVVRPGNVYGPDARLWVDTLVRSLRAGHLQLIDGGRGDAALAYVDNVVDVIARAAEQPGAAGRIYNVNDGGGVTWRRYLTDLANLAGARPPRLVVPFAAARALAEVMERGGKLLGRSKRPLLTREAVLLLSSRHPVPIRRAVSELGFQPICYADAMTRVADYLHGGIA